MPSHTPPVLHPADELNAQLLANGHPPEWVNPTAADGYNLVVIGGGSAGLVAAVGAAGMGARVALIERDILGGDCLNTGCVPSKTLIRSARVMGEMARAERYGIHLDSPPRVDFAAVMRRVRRVRAHLSKHDSAQRFTDLGIDVFFGAAQFTGPNYLEVDGQKLRFTKAIIATGSRAAKLPIEGLAEAGYLTNETVFQLTEQPRRLAIIGAGPIGCELAQTFQRLGTQVTLLEVAPQILIREDKDAAQIVADSLAKDGVAMLLDVKIQKVRAVSGVKCLLYEQNGEVHEVEVDEILLGAGRTPNVDSLNLEAAGVEYTRKGVVVDDTLQTTNSDMYAAGDVALKYQFTHTADASARIVLQNALFPGPKKKFSDLVIPWATFTDPEIAHVGLYAHEAEGKGIEIDTYCVQLDESDRALADGEIEGFVKVHTQKGGDKIVGATIVAPHAGEIISELTLAMTHNLGLKAIVDTIHPYPTVAGSIRRVGDLYNRTRLTPTVGKLFSAWFNWRRA
ncbi:MAG: mercuric reductase [Chloroflexi bacterium]|nr:mercuric reductase [Chloroflexota bacterium]